MSNMQAGARLEMDLPLDHPHARWLNNYQHQAMTDGGLMRHGVMTVTVGGIEQRYDLAEVNWEGYRDDIRLRASWRMYGSPSNAD